MLTNTSRYLKYLNILPGLLYAGSISIVATLINFWVSTWFQLESLTIAIVLGMLANNLIGTHNRLKPGIDFAQKTLLLYGIVLLGLKLDFQMLTSMGLPLIISAIAYMLFVFLIVFILYRFFKLTPKLAALVGVGSSICGAAAVVALAPTIKASKQESLLAVTLVSFLGAIGVLFMAAFSGFSSLSDANYGIWAGLTLHGIAHAIAGAFIRGEVAGEIGTLVKMIRVMMLLPVSIILSMLFRSSTDKIETFKLIPLYLWGFIGAAIIKTSGLLPENIVAFGQWSSSQLILVAMSAMSLSVTFKEIKGKGLKAVLFGLLIFTLSSSVVYLILLY